MTQESERIACPSCQASNYASSSTCWQCGQPLQTQQDQPPPSEPGQPPQWGQQPPSGYPPSQQQQNTQVYIVLGFVCAALGVLCCPVVFSIAAVVLGIIALNKGNRLGVWVIVAGVLSLIIGGVIGYITWTRLLEQGGPWMGPGPNPFQP